MMRLREWDSASPTVNSVTRGVHLDSVATSTVARLAKGRRLIVRDLREGLEIETLSWVGNIRLGALEIAIVPKLAADVLLGLFRYAYGLADIELHDDVRYGDGALSIADLVIAQLRKEADALLARGLHRRYTRRHETLATPRGRVVLGELARGPLLNAALPCVHHPRDVEWTTNRLVRAGLELAAEVVQSKALRPAVAVSARAWARHVSSTHLDLRAVRTERAALDRMTDRYDPALALIELILECTEIGLDGSNDVARLPGFLFDMNKFFEHLVTRYLRDHLEGAEVRGQVQLRTLFAYASAANPQGRSAPVPRPDIEVRVGGQDRVFLDAKYRDLWATKLPREMLYQLAVYAVASPSGNAVILYPTENRNARESVIEMNAGDRRRYVALRPIILPRMLDALKPSGSRVERARLATEIAFGSEVASG